MSQVGERIAEWYLETYGSDLVTPEEVRSVVRGLMRDRTFKKRIVALDADGPRESVAAEVRVAIDAQLDARVREWLRIVADWVLRRHGQCPIEDNVSWCVGKLRSFMTQGGLIVTEVVRSVREPSPSAVLKLEEFWQQINRLTPCMPRKGYRADFNEDHSRVDIWTYRPVGGSVGFGPRIHRASEN